MAAVAPASELVPPAEGGRRFTGRRRVRLGDVDPDGAVRLDAVARYLQDVATDDAADAGLHDGDEPRGWLVRRSLVVIERPARLGEHLDLTTFCSGTGRSWAERRTSIRGDGGAVVEASSLWVQISTVTGRPVPLGERFVERYGTAADGRRVSARLSLPGPGPTAVTRPWAVRRVDLDTFGHVNNAASWAVLEEVRPSGAPRRGRAEVEFPAPVEPTMAVDLHVEPRADDGSVEAWLVAGDVRVAARWIPAGGDRTVRMSPDGSDGAVHAPGGSRR